MSAALRKLSKLQGRDGQVRTLLLMVGGRWLPRVRQGGVEERSPGGDSTSSYPRCVGRELRHAPILADSFDNNKGPIMAFTI